jgi:hypothetical protein
VFKREIYVIVLDVADAIKVSLLSKKAVGSNIVVWRVKTQDEIPRKKVFVVNAVSHLILGVGINEDVCEWGGCVPNKRGLGENRQEIADGKVDCRGAVIFFLSADILAIIWEPSSGGFCPSLRGFPGF